MTEVIKGIWRHVGDLSECSTYADRTDWTYVDEGPWALFQCRHDLVVVSLPRNEEEARKVLVMRQEARDRVKEPEMKAAQTPQEEHDSLMRVAEEADQVYDAMIAKDWGAEPARLLVSSLAEGGYFNRSER